MKSVLISIQPKWCELIANGKKTVEVRKTKPKLDTPFKVYIYCTRNKRQWLRKVSNFVREIFITENKDVIGRTDKVKSLIGDYTTFVENGGYNGKVIGEFVCDSVKMSLVGYNENGCPSYWDILDGSCLTPNELVCYGEWKPLYGWHISNLVIYDKPRELREFYKPCIDEEYQYCPCCKYGHEIFSPDEVECSSDVPGAQYEQICLNRIKRPPQSWCYCESEVQGE